MSASRDIKTTKNFSTKLCPCGQPAHKVFVGGLACKRCIEKETPFHTGFRANNGGKVDCKICGKTFIPRSTTASICHSIACKKRNVYLLVKKSREKRVKRPSAFELACYYE